MLEKVSSNNIIDFSAMRTYSKGTNLCYVSSGRMKRSRRNQPYIVLYIQDSNNLIIPGYIFNVDDVMTAGLELTNVTGRIAEIQWRENYNPEYGVSVIIEKISIAVEVPPDIVSVFVGSVSAVDQKLNELIEFFKTEIKFSTNMPLFLKTLSSEDYSQGAVGGLVEHYWNMMRILQTFNARKKADYESLIMTFVAYIYIHSNNVFAQTNNTDDIRMLVDLTANYRHMIQALDLGEGALELLHLFSGYTPKDIYVRTVISVADLVSKTAREFSIYNTLGVTQEGNAGYGQIRRYKNN